LLEIVARLPWPQRAGELDVRRRLLLLPLIEKRAAEGVVRELVVRREVDERAELGLGLGPPSDAEVGDPEGLPDRTRARLPPLRLLERDRRLGSHPGAEVLAAELEQVVGLGHAAVVPRTDRSDAKPRRRAHTDSSLRACLSRALSSFLALVAFSAPAAGGP